MSKEDKPTDGPVYRSCRKGKGPGRTRESWEYCSATPLAAPGLAGLADRLPPPRTKAGVAAERTGLTPDLRDGHVT
jgi:hypothetical protein